MNREFQELTTGKVQHFFSDYASLEYCHDLETGFWVLQQLDSDMPGEGKKLIQAFVNKIGPNQPVKLLAILEKETCKRLSQLGVLKFVHDNQQTVNITTESTLKTLKTVRVHRGGGIKINKITISPIDPNQVDVDMLLGSPYDINDVDLPYVEISAIGST